MTESDLAARLLPREKILWSGRPGQGLLFTSRDIFLVPFSLLWCGFAIYWTWMAASAPNTPAIFLLFGAVFVVVGLFFTVGRFILDAWTRRGLSYAVTDRRILILRSRPFSRFIAVDLDRLPAIDLTERGDGRGTIRFGPDAGFGALGGVGAQYGIWTPAFDPIPQFIAIAGARQVADLIQTRADR